MVSMKARKVDISIPKVLVSGYILNRTARVPGTKGTSANIHIPKHMAGDYLVILIPREDSGEIDADLQL